MDPHGGGVRRQQSAAALEDLLSREVYGTLPAPESQLVALAHSLIGRGVIDEHTLVARMAAVRARLEAAGDMAC